MRTDRRADSLVAFSSPSRPRAWTPPPLSVLPRKAIGRYIRTVLPYVSVHFPHSKVSSTAREKQGLDALYSVPSSDQGRRLCVRVPHPQKKPHESDTHVVPPLESHRRQTGSSSESRHFPVREKQVRRGGQ